HLTSACAARGNFQGVPIAAAAQRSVRRTRDKELSRPQEVSVKAFLVALLLVSALGRAAAIEDAFIKDFSRIRIGMKFSDVNKIRPNAVLRLATAPGSNHRESEARDDNLNGPLFTRGRFLFKDELLVAAGYGVDDSTDCRRLLDMRNDIVRTAISVL